MNARSFISFETITGDNVTGSTSVGGNHSSSPRLRADTLRELNLPDPAHGLLTASERDQDFAALMFALFCAAPLILTGFGLLVYACFFV